MYERELDEALSIAKDAGKIILEVYATDFDVEYKGKNDPVTVADERANELIVSRLRAAFPEDGIVAEESADKSDGTSRGRVWYVDPLDGTKEFIERNGEFAVMIGLTVDGEARVGAIYQPTKDKLWGGIVGGGAFMIENGVRRELRVSDVREPSKLKLVVSRSHRAKSTDMLVERLGITDEVQHGSVGLKIGMLAEQVADLYVIIANKSSKWDACGPEAVLRAAGGIFTDMNGDPFRYYGEETKNLRGILACNAAAFEAVLPAAREVAKETGLI